MKPIIPEYLALTVYVSLIIIFGSWFLFLYVRERSRNSLLRDREMEDNARAKLHQSEQQKMLASANQDLQRRLVEEQARTFHEFRKMQEELLSADRAGAGSGGYIVVEMPEKDRSLFHDLLKGFEDYAKLKGYQISFSIDASQVGRIAFKFTVQNDGVIVGPERVRKDFKEYIQNVRTGAIEDLENIPVITSIEEHNLLVTNLKNRLTFIHHSYQITKNTLRYYESLFSNMRSFPALPATHVVVQTGGSMDQRSYSAVNSQKILQGDNSTLTDSSINIGNSFNERKERISALDEVIAKLKAEDTTNARIAKAELELSKVRDELADNPMPSESVIGRWLEAAKNAMTMSILGYETIEAGRKLWELFGM